MGIVRGKPDQHRGLIENVVLGMSQKAWRDHDFAARFRIHPLLTGNDRKKALMQAVADLICQDDWQWQVLDVPCEDPVFVLGAYTGRMSAR